MPMLYNADQTENCFGSRSRGLAVCSELPACSMRHHEDDVGDVF